MILESPFAPRTGPRLNGGGGPPALLSLPPDTRVVISPGARGRASSVLHTQPKFHCRPNWEQEGPIRDTASVVCVGCGGVQFGVALSSVCSMPGWEWPSREFILHE